MTDAIAPTPKHPQRGLVRELFIVAGAASIALALPVAVLDRGPDDSWLVVALMSVLALASYPMSRSHNFFAQLCARAVWWQALAFGVVLAIGWTTGALNGPISAATPMYVLGGAFAIGGAGETGLDFASSHFVPVAYRRSLTASLIMAMADTIALLFYASIVVLDGPSSTVAVNTAEFLGAATVMIVAISGLYRIKVWGLALNIIANILIAVLAVSGVFEIPMVLACGLAATALAQLLLPIPLLMRMVSRRSV